MNTLRILLHEKITKQVIVCTIGVLLVKYYLFYCANPEIGFINSSARLFVYNKGRIVQERPLDPGTSFDALKSLIDNKKDKWQTSYTGYAPETLIVSRLYHIDIHKHFVVVNYRDKHLVFRQVISNLSSAEYEFIEKALGLHNRP